MPNMPPSRSADFSKVLERVRKVREQYESSSSQYENFLVYGHFGTGKTTLSTTCPRPVFIDCFDRGGTKTRALQPLIESGDIIVDNRWEDDSWKDPWAFREWEREMRRRESEGFFNHIGTYMLDSITSWSESMMYEILKVGDGKTGSRKGQIPQLQDYLKQQLTAVDWLGVMAGYNCHVVVTGHIGIDKDEVTGKMVTGLLLWGKLAIKVPNVFDEKYVTRVVNDQYVLQTRKEGIYQAETRMGGGIFNTFEEPNIKKLLEKAGRSFDDKPPLIDSIEDKEVENDQPEE